MTDLDDPEFLAWLDQQGYLPAALNRVDLAKIYARCDRIDPHVAAAGMAARKISDGCPRDAFLDGLEAALNHRDSALATALEPFADVDGEGDDDFPDDTAVTATFGRSTYYALTLGDFRRARAAFGKARG
jgi:hypothetical protein